jgi:hypothetical protein
VTPDGGTLARDRPFVASAAVVGAAVAFFLAGPPLAALLLGHGPNELFLPAGLEPATQEPVGPWTVVVDEDGEDTLLVLGADGILGRDQFLRRLGLVLGLLAAFSPARRRALGKPLLPLVPRLTAAAVAAEALLSFAGLGIELPTSSLGNLLGTGVDSAFERLSLLLVPLAVLVVLIVALVTLGVRLDRNLTPAARKSTLT